MKKSLLITLALLASALAACRGGGPGDEARPTPISAPAAAEGGGSAEEGGGVGQAIPLRVWTHRNDTFNPAYQALADAYMAANPGVTIVFEAFDPNTYAQTLQDALLAGMAADVVQLPGNSVCSLREHLASVPETVVNLVGAQALYLPEPLGSFTCDGILFGLPQESATPWGLGVSDSGASHDASTGDLGPQSVAWDFVRFVALDSANAAGWNSATGTPPALQGGSAP